jgi:bacillithiol biosynthesis deacetylase BshB1
MSRKRPDHGEHVDEHVDALAIGAHPDDVELQAGGTLLRLRTLGYSTGIIALTRGERATRGTPSQRAREAAEAAGILGVRFSRILDLGDTALMDGPDLRHQLVRLVRRHRPSLVLSHHADELHPDHGAVAAALKAAVHLAGLARLLPELPPHRPAALLGFALLGRQPADLAIDISAWAALKRQALACFRSQFQPGDSTAAPTLVSGPSFLDDLGLRQRHYGSLIGTAHAEAFTVGRMIAIEDPIRTFSRSPDLFGA